MLIFTTCFVFPPNIRCASLVSWIEHAPSPLGKYLVPLVHFKARSVQVNFDNLPLLLNLPPSTRRVFPLTRLECWCGVWVRGSSSTVYFIAKSPSRGFWILMYRCFVPMSSFPIIKSSSSNKLKDCPEPANLGNVVIAAEHFGDKTSTSPPFEMMSAAAGWQTKVDGLKGS